jgi:hypothetical protein
MALPPMAQALDRDSGREALFSEPADLAMVHRVIHALLGICCIDNRY